MVTPLGSTIVSASSLPIDPTIARDPQKLVGKREPSSSQIATTSGERLGLPRAFMSASVAVSPATMPSAPSSRPPCRTVSMCDPVTITLPFSVPSSRPQRLPTASRRVSSPAFFIHRSTQSPASAHAVPYRGRAAPPPRTAPRLATLLAHFARRPLDHLVALGMHTDERVEPRRHLESDREQAVGHAMKVLDAAFTHECLEPHDAAPGERRQLREVLGNHPAPEAKVDECLLGRDGDLRIEGRDGRGRWMGVERHLEDRGNAAARRTARPRLPSLPLGAARLVEVDVRINDAGEHDEAARVDDFVAALHFTSYGADGSIRDGNVGGLLASREDYGTGTYENGVAHRTSSITISCAPSQSVSLPISGNCSCPCVIVAK